VVAYRLMLIKRVAVEFLHHMCEWVSNSGYLYSSMCGKWS